MLFLIRIHLYRLLHEKKLSILLKIMQISLYSLAIEHQGIMLIYTDRCVHFSLPITALLIKH